MYDFSSPQSSSENDIKPTTPLHDRTATNGLCSIGFNWYIGAVELFVDGPLMPRAADVFECDGSGKTGGESDYRLMAFWSITSSVNAVMLGNCLSEVSKEVVRTLLSQGSEISGHATCRGTADSVCKHEFLLFSFNTVSCLLASLVCAHTRLCELPRSFSIKFRFLQSKLAKWEKNAATSH